MSLKERIDLVKQQFGISEASALSIEKALGNKLVDYESIDALVAALMGYYNPLIQGIDEKFKNFCPYAVGEILSTTNSENPASKYLGTTWQKIEGRFLLGTSGNGTSKQTGGSMTKIITQANLPNVKITVDSFSLSRGTMDIIGSGGTWRGYSHQYTGSGAIYYSAASDGPARGDQADPAWMLNFKASRAWTGTTSSASPQTSVLGNGSALDITPNYYTVHMWLRTS